MANAYSQQEEELYKKWREAYDDPTLLLIDPVNGIKQIKSGLPIAHPPAIKVSPVSLVSLVSPQLEIEKGTVTADNRLFDGSAFKQLIKIRGNILGPDLSKINPFASISQSIFGSIDGVKLANIEAIFNQIKKEGGYFFPRSAEPAVYCDLGGAPGGFIRYLQWRYPSSFGYGVSLSPMKGGLAWNEKAFDLKRLEITSCPDGSGDIVNNLEWIVKWILQIATFSGEISVCQLAAGRMVNLVLGHKISDDEAKNMPTLVAQIAIGLSILWPGGNMIIEMAGSKSKMSADLILLMGLTFDQVYLFKPISSNPAENGIYLIASGYQQNNNLAPTISGLLKKVNQLQRDGLPVKSLILDDNYYIRPEIKEIVRKNNQSIQRQLLLSQQIQSPALKPHYLTYYTGIYWNIPS